MSSQINPNNIDGAYPVAGQDNDSQGFRDNFTNIRNNLTFAKAELEDLQSKVVLKSALLNTTLDNDFAGNTISNPAFSSYREAYNNIGSVSGSVTIDFANGNFQKFTMAGSTTLTFSFPSNSSNQLASIKLWIVNTNSAYTLTLPSAVTLGDPDTIAGLSGTSPPIITFGAAEISNNTNYLFEFFTVDAGTTIGIKDLVRNRDVDLSGMSITGNLTLDGLSVSTYPVSVTPNFSVAGNALLGSSLTATVGSNVVVRSNIGSTSSTTGALVITGGAGVGGNVYTAGNTISAGGKINPNYFLANVVTGQNLFANVNYNRFIANASPIGTVANLFITLPNSVEDGRELEFVTTTAMTACFISNMTPDVTSVYGLANTWAASASITNSVMVRLMYNSTVGRWFKVN